MLYDPRWEGDRHMPDNGYQISRQPGFNWGLAVAMLADLGIWLAVIWYCLR